MSLAVEIGALLKHYKGNIEPALKGIDLKVEKNTIFGLLGPNGAGKTSLISILAGILKPDLGYVKVFEQSVSEKNKNYRRFIGLVPQEIALYPTLTARENLTFFGRMYKVPRKELDDKIQYWLKLLGLDQQQGKLVQAFSGGMKRRLNLIAALLHDPDLVILDEPTVGVDVHSKNILLEQLLELKKQGKTIIYTSHQLEEAEQICDYLVIIDKGCLLTGGTPEKLLHGNFTNVRLEEYFLTITGKELRD